MRQWSDLTGRASHDSPVGILEWIKSSPWIRDMLSSRDRNLIPVLPYTNFTFCLTHKRWRKSIRISRPAYEYEKITGCNLLSPKVTLIVHPSFFLLIAISSRKALPCCFFLELLSSIITCLGSKGQTVVARVWVASDGVALSLSYVYIITLLLSQKCFIAFSLFHWPHFSASPLGHRSLPWDELACSLTRLTSHRTQISGHQEQAAGWVELYRQHRWTKTWLVLHCLKIRRGEFITMALTRYRPRKIYLDRIDRPPVNYRV